MKRNYGSWIKQYGIFLLLATVAITVAVTGSLAAYVNFSSVKRVVSTGQGSQTLFSSNYLYLLNLTDTDYSLRRITPIPVKDNQTGEVTGYTFTVQICNYIYGNPGQVNTKKIVYDLRVGISTPDGGELPAGCENITLNKVKFERNRQLSSSGELPASIAQMDSYTIYLPSEVKDHIRFEIVASPREDSQDATNGQKLAVKLTMADLTLTHTWTGRFLDDQKHDLKDYSGLNYEISGSGIGMVTLTWDSNVLVLSPWFSQEVSGSLRDNICTFQVGGEGKPEAYQLQFYPKDRGAFQQLTWEDISGLVWVTFTPGTGN